MTGIRDDFRELADEIRTISGPTVFDIRASQLVIRQRTWASGFRGGDGGFTDVDLPITQIYHFRQLTTREIAGSGGRYEMGDLKIGPITPTFSSMTTGGFSEAQLKPTVGTNGVENIFLITGQHAGEYDIIELQSTKAFSFFVVIRRRRTTP